MAKEMTSEGPAPGRTRSPAAAVPMVAKMPAPMIAPIPRRVMFKGPRVRFRAYFGSLAEARMSSRFFLSKMPRRGILLRRNGAQDPACRRDRPVVVCQRRREHDTAGAALQTVLHYECFTIREGEPRLYGMPR